MSGDHSLNVGIYGLWSPIKAIRPLENVGSMSLTSTGSCQPQATNWLLARWDFFSEWPAPCRG